MLKPVVPGLLLCALSNCYRDTDNLQFGPGEYRCVRDGFCFHPTGNYSLQAAYREGVFEIRVDVVDAQVQYGKSPQNLAVLVSDHHDNPLMVSDSGRIPKTWRIRHQDAHAVRHISEFTAERFAREKLLEKLAASLRQKVHAKNSNREEAYLLAKEITEGMVERNEGFRAGDPSPAPKSWKRAVQEMKKAECNSSCDLSSNVAK